MPESVMKSSPSFTKVITPAAGYTVGQVIQLPDGRAGVISGTKNLASGEAAAVQIGGHRTLAKTASLNILEGGKVYWDRSANTATPLLALTGADFYVGTCVVDSLATATTVVVDINNQPSYTIDLLRDAGTSVAVGDATIGFFPGYAKLSLLATSEAEKIDLLSDASIPVTIPFIVEGRMASFDGSTNAVDMNVGIANATHASDADTITESVFIHLNETADLKIYAESDDGTTEVAATDTTVVYVDDTYFDFVMDCRDLTDIQIYVNGVNVLPASVFKLNAATGPMKLLAHIEKTTGTATGEMRIGHLALRAMDVV